MPADAKPGAANGGVAAPPRGFRDILPTEAREIRAKAKAFLEAAKGTGKIEALAARVERFEEALAAKDEEIAELRAENARLALSQPPQPAPTPQRNARGRRTRADDVAQDVADTLRGVRGEARSAEEDDNFV